MSAGRRIAYLLGRAPQPRSTFTTDEITALRARMEVIQAGLIAAGGGSDWVLGPSLRSLAMWRAVGSALVRRPLGLLGGIGALVRPSLVRPRDALTAVRAGLAACALAREARPELIHAQFVGPAAAGAYVWHRLSGQPFTVRAHAYDIYRSYRWAGVVLRSATSVFAISDHAAGHIHSTWGVRASVIRVGIAPDAVPARGDEPPSRPLRLLAVGALEPKKGHDLLIEAVRIVNHDAERVTLDIYGDGSLEEELRTQASGLPVTLPGRWETVDMRARFAHYDAFALGARIAPDGDTDGIPVVLLEASLAGLPVVTTNVAGIPELIEHEVTGWGGPATPEMLAAGIDAVITDYAAARSRAAAARQRVWEQHDLDRQTNRLVDAWAAILDSAASRP